MKTFRAAALSALIAGNILLAGPAALGQGAPRIQEIVVEGTQRIEDETVRSYMSIAEGDAFDAGRVDKSLKSLFATGLFADVALRRDGDRLIVRVVENPIINRIAFEGNKRIDDETLQTEVQLRPRVVYTRTKVQNDVKRILDVYRRQGRFAATVDPKVIQLDQNRVDLAFEIDEGPSTYVDRIAFVGNKKYDDSKLTEVIQTKEERWYRIFSTDDTYDPDRVTYDRELLRRFYLSHGYADFKVISAVAELTPDRSGFFVTFTIEEGERYRFGDINVASSIKDLQPESLRPLVTAEKGEWYDADEVENTIQALTDAVGNKGFAFVDIKPKVDRKPEDRIVDLSFDIQEGPRVFVDRIDITGNVRTLDKVIRREFRLVEGDAFNAAKLRRSEQRIRNLNFFEKVDVETVPSETAPDRMVLKVDVEEKSTGELSFGIGWSTSAGPLAEVGLRERNLLGRGQDLRASVSVGAARNEIDLSFTEPYFLDRPVSAGIDLFAITRELQDESSYDSETLGGALRTAFYYNEALRQDLKYGLRREVVENVDSTASTFIQEQEGTAVVSSVSQTLTYDKRDSRLDPTEGYFTRVNNELAGLGGTERFFRTNLGAGQYFTLADQVILGLSASAGHIIGIGKDVRITERYFLGGDTLRGFSTAGVSPRDKTGTKDALGGLWMAAGSAQVSFPLGLPQEYGFKGQVFTDVGAIGPTEGSDKTNIDESSTPRVSVGAGVSWKSPMGPLSVDIGFPIVKKSFDETELFRFTFGTRF